MAKQPNTLVPYSKQHDEMDAVKCNLNLVSTLLSVFLAVVVKKHPDIKDGMTNILTGMMSIDGMTSDARETLREALGVVAELTTEDEFVH